MKREQEANPKLEPSEKGTVLGLEIEELEQIVAPLIASNSNETLLTDPESEKDSHLCREIEELEPIISPGMPGIRMGNSNETLVSDPEEV